MFWDKGYLFEQNLDDSKLEVYSLKDNGRRLKALDFSGMPFAVMVKEGKVHINDSAA